MSISNVGGTVSAEGSVPVGAGGRIRFPMREELRDWHRRFDRTREEIVA